MAVPRSRGGRAMSRAVDRRHDGYSGPAQAVGPQMMNTLRLKIVHGDHIYRQCIADALAATGRFSVIDFAENAGETRDSLHDHPADVFLIDWSLPQEHALELPKHIVR